MYVSKYKMTPQNKTSAEKKYFTLNFIHLIHSTSRFYLPWPVSVTVYIFTVIAFIFLTIAANINPQCTELNPICN
jgi:hypothetical protein